MAPSPAASATSSTLHNQDQQPGTTANAEPAANARSSTPPHRHRPLEAWWVRHSCPHWWLVLGAVWPAASYVLTGWDCANPTHVTAYNKDKLCESGPRYLEEPLDHEYQVLQHVMVQQAKGFSCELAIWSF